MSYITSISNASGAVDEALCEIREVKSCARRSEIRCRLSSLISTKACSSICATSAAVIYATVFYVASVKTTS